MKSLISSFIDLYERPATKVLVKVLNVGCGGILAPIDEAVNQSLTAYKKKKLKAFFDAIDNEEVLLTDDHIKSDDFLHAYFLTANAVLRSRTKRKIELFAKAISMFAKKDFEKYADEYQEFVSILLELSDTELAIIGFLDKFEILKESYKIKKFSEKNDMANALWSSFWQSFDKGIKKIIPEDEIATRLSRLERTGLVKVVNNYVQEGDYFSSNSVEDMHPIILLTPMYYRFKDYFVAPKLY